MELSSKTNSFCFGTNINCELWWRNTVNCLPTYKLNM